MMPFILRCLLGWLSSACIFVWAGAGRLPAFPEAEGDGAWSVGGRGGKVLVVDRLDDPCPTKACTTEDLADPAKLTPGTFRWALMQPYPRTVVFRVSGVITLLNDLTTWNEKTQQVDIQRLANIRIKSPFLTVAGQTAPAGGITLRNNGVTILAQDVVMRYLSFRTGRQLPVYAGQQTPETLMIENGADRTLIDHCSFSWMPAEGLSVYTGEMWHGIGTAGDITLSWNLVGEGLVRHEDGRGHPSAGFMSGFDGDPQYAARRVTLHHNLFVHTQKRNADLLSHEGRLINNLIYNWQWFPTVLGGGVKADVIGNVWKPGPVTLDYPAERGAIHLVPSDLDQQDEDPMGWWHAVRGEPSLYLSENVYGKTTARSASVQDLVCAYRVRGAACDKTLPASWLRQAPQPVTGRAVTIEPVAVAEKSVLAAAGNSRRINAWGEWVSNRDVVDERYVREYASGTYQRSQFPWHEDEVGGFPVTIDGLPYPDQDRDGMSDVWEKAENLNPADPADALLSAEPGGYTHLERFINGHAGKAARLGQSVRKKP